jgi:hypothetical protein
MSMTDLNKVSSQLMFLQKHGKCWSLVVAVVVVVAAANCISNFEIK